MSHQNLPDNGLAAGSGSTLLQVGGLSHQSVPETIYPTVGGSTLLQIGGVFSGEQLGCASSGIGSSRTASLQCPIPSPSSCVVFPPRQSLSPVPTSHTKPPRPNAYASSPVPALTSASAVGSGSRAASPYSNTGSQVASAQTAYDVYMATAGSLEQQRAVPQRQLQHVYKPPASSVFAPVSTAVPAASQRMDASPGSRCHVKLTGRPGVETRAATASQRMDASPGSRCHVHLSGRPGTCGRATDASPGPGVIQGASRGRVVATAVRSASGRPLICQTTATTGAAAGIRVMTPPPPTPANAAQIGAHASVQAPVGQPSGPAAEPRCPDLRLGRSLSPSSRSHSPLPSPVEQVFRPVNVPRLRSPKSWQRRPTGETPSNARSDEEDWAADDFISHRRSESESKPEERQPEQVIAEAKPMDARALGQMGEVKKTLRRTARSSESPDSHHAGSEPERSPERLSDRLPEVINCRRPYQECFDERHGRSSIREDFERSFEERIAMWEKQHQAQLQEQFALQHQMQADELRGEMARLKEASNEEIAKLRTEVERLQQARRHSPLPRGLSQAERPTPRAIRRADGDISPNPTRVTSKFWDARGHGRENAVAAGPAEVSVANLQAELQLREESNLAAQEQISQLQREVEELRAMKKATFAKEY